MQTRVIALCACTFLFTSLLHAKDAKPPWWRLVDDGATWGVFELRAEDIVMQLPTTWIVKTTTNVNPYMESDTSMTIVYDAIHTNRPGPDGPSVPCFYFPGITNQCGFLIENNPETNELKHARMQFTATMQPVQGTVQFITQYPPTNHTMNLVDTIQHQNGWATYVYDITVSPNPPGETVIFWMETGAYLDQVVADTWCVPEPCGAFAALALLCVARRRR